MSDEVVGGEGNKESDIGAGEREEAGVGEFSGGVVEFLAFDWA